MEKLLGLDPLGCEDGKYNLHGVKAHILLEGTKQKTDELISKIVKETIGSTKIHVMMSSMDRLDDLLLELNNQLMERRVKLASHGLGLGGYTEYNSNGYGEMSPMLVIIPEVPLPHYLSIRSRAILNTFLQKGHTVGIHLIMALEENIFPRDNAHVVKFNKVDPLDLFSAMPSLTEEAVNSSKEEFIEWERQRNKDIMYSVNTDKELFDRFKEMERRLEGLSRLFQNPGMVMTSHAVDQFITDRDSFKKDVEVLLQQASERIEKVPSREYIELFNKLSKELGL